MGEYLDQIPENVREHVKEIAKSSKISDMEEKIEMVAKAWLEKKSIFEERIASAEMEEAELLQKDDDRGSLIMTYSGSLLNIGPIVDGVRKVEYSSIGLREDVPERAEKENSELESDIDVDEQITFAVGPIKTSSPVFKIAVCKGNLTAEDQEEKLQDITMVLEEEFVEVNKTIIAE